MTRQTTNQAAQRAKVSHRRRSRGPSESKHGERSQSGVKVRSTAGWKAYLVRYKARFDKAKADEETRAGWREREAQKRADAEAARA